jgi:hydrogenase-4 component E
MLENGIFLLSLSVANEMPWVVNIGVLLDVFVAVFILGLLVGEIGVIYENPEVGQISNLKDFEGEEHE